MEEKVIEYLVERYMERESIEINVEIYGKKRTISESLKMIIGSLGIQEEYIRKEMSRYIGRIVSEVEFRNMIEWGIVPC